jgi:Flp pilus assembly protein TadB
MNEKKRSGNAWPLERVLFAMAGTMAILSAVLSALVSEWFLLLTAFVGANQLLYVAVGACPASMILGRALGLKSAYVGCDTPSVSGGAASSTGVTR